MAFCESIVDGLLTVAKKIPFWIFVLIGTLFAILIAFAIFFVSYYVITGQYLSDTLIFLGILTPLITAFICFYLTAKIIQRLIAAEQGLSEYSATLEWRIEGEVKKRESKELMLERQSRAALMGELMGAVAHQWRQPLNALGIMIQDVRFAYDEGELGRKYIDEFVDGSMKQIGFMSKIIDDFRNFFSPDSQKGDFLPKRGIEGALLVITPELLKYGIKIHTDIEYENPIVGYEREFKQILLALLTNSKDAIVENVSIKREISISLKEDGDFVVVSVEDTGGGIDEGVSHRIFEPYFSTKPQGKGVGIALYMAKQVIDRHLGGDISFFNTEYGVCFTVRLPKHGEAVR